jgi:hypothetical protein
MSLLRKPKYLNRTAKPKKREGGEINVSENMVVKKFGSRTAEAS